MKIHRIIGTRPARTSLCFIAVLTVCAFLLLRGVGSRTVLEYACEVKPYSLVVSPDSYSAFSKNKDSTKIICLGDSSFFFPGGTNVHKDGTNIANLLQAELKKSGVLPDVTVLERAWSGADMFAYYCMYYQSLEFSSDLIIVLVNWRLFSISPSIEEKNRKAEQNNADFFGPDGVRRPGYELSALAPVYDKWSPASENPIRLAGISPIRQMAYKLDYFMLYPLGIKMWALDNLGEFFGAADSDNFPSEAAGTNDGNTEPATPSADIPGELSEEQRLFVRPGAPKEYYLMEITENNRTFQQYRALANVASRRGTRILFFIWPVNKEHLAKVGAFDDMAFDRSRSLIEDVAAKNNLPLLDLSALLKSPSFYDLSGHCMLPGRQKIAESLASEVIRILEPISELPENTRSDNN